MTIPRLANFAVALVVVGLLWLGLVLNFDFGLLRPALERHLSAQLGRIVHIGTLTRLDRGFHPTLRIGELRIAQPAWAGPGDMLHVRTATVGLRLGPLLLGRPAPDSLDIDGLRVAFVRHDGAHANWKHLPFGQGGGSLRHIAIHDGLVTLDDRKRDHRFAAQLIADDAHFRLAGPGSLAGHASRIALTGPTLARAGPWPFQLDYRSAIVSATLIGRADHPLDLGHFTAHASGSGDDLRSLDRLIEAGLPGTQPFRLAGEIGHAKPDWTIRNLSGRIGRSDVALSMAVKMRAGRTLLDGDVSSNALAFDDLASNEGRARAAAKRAALGPRIVPDTAIHLEHMRRTDGTLRIDFRHLLFDKPSTFRSLGGTITLDHGVLTAAPLVMGLAAGRVTGWARVRHVSGPPRLTADLRLSDSRLEAIIPQDFLTGSLSGRLRLAGYGRTIREAAGHSTGSIALVARNGMVTRRAALFLGSDIGRAIFENKQAKAAMPCLIARLDAQGGQAHPAPFLLDTDVARIDAQGSVDLSTERLSLSVTGHPKLAHPARLETPLQIGGVLAQPRLVPPSIPKTVGTALTLIGNAIAGKKTAPAADADCATLATQALR